MENAKRTATDFLVPPVMDQAIKKAGRMNVYQFWRDFSPEEKFLLKGLEQEAQGSSKSEPFRIWAVPTDFPTMRACSIPLS